MEFSQQRTHVLFDERPRAPFFLDAEYVKFLAELKYEFGFPPQLAYVLAEKGPSIPGS